MKTILLIDGGYTRACAGKSKKTYDNDFIENLSKKCIVKEENLLRVLYYDAPKYKGKAKLPVSGNSHNFHSNDAWLTDLAKRNKFAVRKGNLGFRGWKPKSTPISGKALTDNDFIPIFEQKGVDMRIGLDIASYSHDGLVDRLILISGDTDMVAAMKHARKCAVEVGVVQLPKPSYPIHDKLKMHSDFIRNVSWP